MPDERVKQNEAADKEEELDAEITRRCEGLNADDGVLGPTWIDKTKAGPLRRVERDHHNDGQPT